MLLPQSTSTNRKTLKDASISKLANVNAKPARRGLPGEGYPNMTQQREQHISLKRMKVKIAQLSAAEKGRMAARRC